MKNISKLFILTAIGAALLGCKSNLERTLEKGFKSEEEKALFERNGYKTYKDFADKHPYEISSSSMHFAEAEIGKELDLYGAKISTKSPYSKYLTRNKTLITSINHRQVTSATFNCGDHIYKSIGVASIDNVTCGDNTFGVERKLGNYERYCSTSDPHSTTIYYIVKNNAFFHIINDGVYSMGLFMKPFEYSAGLGDTKYVHYIPCEKALADDIIAKSLGFTSPLDMEEARADGKETKDVWEKYKKFKKFHQAKEQFDNILEKSTVIYASTLDEFKIYKEQGGLEYMSKWRGYEVQSIQVLYRENIASTLLISVDRIIKFPNDAKIASVVNIKRDIELECGNSWIAGQLSGRDAYFAETEDVTCRFTEDTWRGGMSIEIARKQDR